MSGGFRSRLLWALLVIGALTACVAVPSALAQPPYTLAIQNVGSSTNVSCTGSPTMTCVATGDGAVLSTTDLDNDLNGVTDPAVTKVVVGDASTTTTIVVDDPVSGSDPLEFAAAAETTGSVTLQAPTVTFDQGVSGTGALTISGNAVFTGSSDIDSLEVDGTASLSGSISTTTSQTYEDAVSLTEDTTLATTGGTGQVTFDSTVNGGSSLTLTGAAEFDGAVGGTIELASISASGATTIDADISTSGSQSYAGATTFGATPLELSGSKATFASGSTVDGATDLTISGSAEFDGTIGGGTALNSLSVSGNTTLDGALTTSGHQTYTGAVSLTGDSTLTETQNASSVKFDSTVDGAFHLSVTGNAEFDGAVGGGTPLTTISVSRTTTLGASITTTGDQTYTGAVTLGTSVSLGSNDTIEFHQAVLGSGPLSMVGAGTLQLDVLNSYTGGTQVHAGTVEFVSGGLGTGPVTLNGGTLKWAAGNTADISPKLTLGSPGGALDTNGNAINFADALSSTGTLTKTGGGNLTLVGSGSYGSALDVNGGSVIVPSSTTTATPIVVNSGGTLNCDDGTLNGGVTNSGGTTTGGPATPVLTNVSAPGSTATVSFTGAANCRPTTYVANTTAGGASNQGTASPLSVSGLAASTTYTFTVTATNPIGSTTSGPVSATTPNPPSVSFSTPANGATFLFNQKVNAHYTCSDSNGPGISGCQSSLASGAALDTSTPGLHSLSVTATSSDGYTSTRTVDYSVARPLPPVITVVNPVDGSKYTHHQRIVASYSCLDSALGTGIASCVGSAPSGSPLATTTLGTHTFTVQATSKDGATAMLTVRYTVVAPPNTFSLAAGARAHGAIRVALTNLHTPGVVKLTVRRPGTVAFSVTRTVKSGSGFTYTLNATAPLRRSLAAAGHPTLKASVSVTYTPHGGSPRIASAKVTLLR